MGNRFMSLFSGHRVWLYSCARVIGNHCRQFCITCPAYLHHNHLVGNHKVIKSLSSVQADSSCSLLYFSFLFSISSSFVVSRKKFWGDWVSSRRVRGLCFL
ncbi:hypothetical protein I7I50_11823 [Histoplasma capsulatum G186AR]|uniref:Uncharacterized protein n=1 Tax=Ajellomyces capsulatus TaxID=5037 RepID=A0A8H7Z8E9_AJECA|nr:hypothetical protein I7I52_03061 [Histoplasma capsulatum]QSS70254.1 hypothetical protein I7I50_11823 [Histoplasma capsulatum G186AR]